ncbi:gephyrin-like molybdotransferase Glp [Paenibacillus naphthalenovorans]|uniref:Molybdopterin molybdenumtransferase n=1 Tax=Paenibacillus naphthalenovorans TaxID=162209 RepID=A0A0U2VKT2_9BACL|nr:gephyrin-like molybdotransferase Glp [Paenibacillus naphthalenovorans]ALS23971.1 molybdenum cofactor biosynthesis protein [Paenibacillus naphthalenovorans]
MALYIPNASPIPLEEAQRLVLATVRPLPLASIPLSRAYGYCLADPVLSDHNVPMYDRSTVDGYALRAEDVKWASRSTPVKLNTIEEIPAGHIPEKQIAPGMASRIMTGAPIPKGADAVVKVEETEIGEDEGRSSVWIYRSVTAGESILRKGADVEEGTIILPEGTFIGPVEAGLLSTFGVGVVPVYDKPKVGILSTGSELLPVDQQISPGKHRDSNGVMLAGQVRAAGGDPVYLGIVQDHPEELEKRITEALQQVDVLVTSGGVSMGDYDFLGNTFEKIGAKVVFWKTLIRPGMPALFGTWQDKPIFALAGNPASSYVNAWLYLLPAIRRMCGRRNPLPQRLTGICDEPIAMMPMPHTRFLRGFAYISSSGELRVKIARKQASGILSSFLESNCLVRVPGEKGYAAGERVEMDLIGTLGESVCP